ncbi:TPA: hypothetical protein DD448_00840 [Candidatus Collierbacteria bacterium]|nr:hypothetical protein [Candidatus Collierbacteria bacterium]
MNKEFISAHIADVIETHPEIEVMPPGTLPPADTATHMISLLRAVYVNHGIANRVRDITRDIESGNLQTWLAKREGQLVATASLVHQPNGDVEIGRAVSLEKGNGKLLMLLASLAHLKNNSDAPIVAEVRAAEQFGGIPSGEATQHICFELLDLVPHALAPFFNHGGPVRNESFILARSDRQPGRTATEMVLSTLTNRDLRGRVQRVKLVQDEPFQIIVPDTNGSTLSEIWTAKDIQFKEGFTLFPIEVTDANLALVGTLLTNPRIVMCGIAHRQGENGKPIILFGTVGKDTKVAPSKITDALAPAVRRDLQILPISLPSLAIKISTRPAMV